MFSLLAFFSSWLFSSFVVPFTRTYTTHTLTFFKLSNYFHPCAESRHVGNFWLILEGWPITEPWATQWIMILNKKLPSDTRKPSAWCDLIANTMEAALPPTLCKSTMFIQNLLNFFTGSAFLLNKIWCCLICHKMFVLWGCICQIQKKIIKFFWENNNSKESPFFVEI